jgi:hypothetical protein
MTTASTISTLFGKMARFSPLKRARRLNHRFLCPNCLHFGGFDFACGECWAEIPGYAEGKTQTCPRCQRSLLSADGSGVRAYCKQCKWNCDRAIYHQREVRVLATLRPADSASLYQAISGKEYQPQGGKGYVYDDGEWLAYVLNLSDFTDEAYSLPPAHALWEVESIWLDVSASDPKELALEWGEAADRFIAQAKLTEAQRHAMTIFVQQAESALVVKSVLETRFGSGRYGITAQAFLFERAQAKALAQEEIGHNSTVPALTAVLKDIDSDKWKDWASKAAAEAAMTEEAAKVAAEALVRIGKPAVPALIATLKYGDWGVRKKAAETLGEIGDDSAVPALIAALKEGGRGENYWMATDWAAEAAVEALVKIGKAAVPALIAALTDKDKYMRYWAAKALVKIGDVSAVPALKTADRAHHEQQGCCPFCDALRQLGAK